MDGKMQGREACAKALWPERKPYKAREGRPLEETKEWAELSTLPVCQPECNGKQSAFKSKR